MVLLFLVRRITLHKALIVALIGTLVVCFITIRGLNEHLAKLLLLIEGHVTGLRRVGIQEFVCGQKLLSALLLDPREACHIGDCIFDLIGGPRVLAQHLLLFELYTVDVEVKYGAFSHLLVLLINLFVALIG